MANRRMIIAITGGIGSGKSYICKLLEEKGIAVYDCDAAAKRLMREDPKLQAGLKQLVGNDVYINKVLQKSILAQFLLTSESNKQAINDVVHPTVATNFLQSSYQWLESAILFESHFDRRIHPDKVVCVTAPFDIRVERVMKRDRITRELAKEWIEKQMPQEEMIRLSDFEIVNDGQADLYPQIEQLLNQLY